MDTPIEADAEESGAEQVPSATKKANVALSSVSRQLTDKELSSSGAQKLLLDKIEYMEEELHGLRGIRNDYHAADKCAAILREKLKTRIAVEILSGCSLAAGAALLGFAPSLWPSQSATGIYLIVAGALLSLGAIVAKAVKA